MNEASILGILSYCEMKRRPFVDFSAKSRYARVMMLAHTEYEAISASMTPGLSGALGIDLYKAHIRDA